MDTCLRATPTASCSRAIVSFKPCARLVKGSTPAPRAGNVTRHQPPGQLRVPPCRVTNTGEEMRDPDLYDFDPDIVERSQYQIPHPERGPLVRQIELTFEDALFQDADGVLPDYELMQEHTNYWFTQPEGGWNQTPKRLRKATEVPNEDAKSANFGEGRIALAELKEGQEVVGTINRLMLLHGVQVDIGAQFDALIPLPGSIWSNPQSSDDASAVHEVLSIDAEVRIKIDKVVPSPICRFPIIAELLTPQLPASLQGDIQKHQKLYEPVFNLSGQSDMTRAMELTGRTYTPISYTLDTTPDAATRKLMAMQDAQEDEAKEIQDAVAPSVLVQIRDMAGAM